MNRNREEPGKVRIFLLALVIVVSAVLFIFAVQLFDGKTDFEIRRHAYFRIPVPGDSYAHYAFNAVGPLESKQASFTISTRPDSVLEVGLVRVDNNRSYWGYSGDYRFRVFERGLLKKRALFETTINLKLNECVRFELDTGGLKLSAPSAEIICEVEKAESNVEKGYEAHRDFAFIVPSVFDRREGGDCNVLLVSFDTLRPDHLGYSGYYRDTSPNIDAFAGNNIIFTDAVSPSPWTGPAHYSLFTSLNPSAYCYWSAGGNGESEGNAIENVVFLPATTLAEILEKEGYYTVAVTGGGLVGTEFGFGRGFKGYWEYNSYGNADSAKGPWVFDDDTKKIFEKAFDWLEQNREKKFFMFLHNYECHIPYENTFFVSEENRNSLIEHRKALYDGDIKVADSYFGKLMDKLDSLDLISNTVIVFLSDHGEDFYDHYTEEDIIPEWKEPVIPEISVVDHSHSLYEELIRIPLIVHMPGPRSLPRVIDNQVRLTDVMPTIIDALDIQCDGPLEGESLLGLIRTGQRESDPPAMSEFTQLGPERKSVRENGYKYIWIENPRKCWNFNFRNLSPKELFNLRNDPAEKKNIYDHDTETANRLHKQLEQETRKSLAIKEVLLRRHGPARGRRELDNDVADQLKALGYLK